MLVRTLLGVVLAALTFMGPLGAEQVQSPPKRVKITGTDYEIDFTNSQLSGVLPPRALIKAIKSWLSLNYNLRASYPDPYIELAAPEKIIGLHYHGFLSDAPRDSCSESESAGLIG